MRSCRGASKQANLAMFKLKVSGYHGACFRILTSSKKSSKERPATPLLKQILHDGVRAPPYPLRGIRRRQRPVDRRGKGRRLCWHVARAFHRIALPLFYHDLVVHSSSQSAALLNTLRARPDLAKAVRTLVLPNASVHDAELMRLLPGLWDLDITLPPNSAQVDALVAAVLILRTLRTLAVRKAAGTYLSQPAPCALLDALADAVYTSAELTSTTLAFPLSADPALTRLASALSTAPALQTLRTPLPSAWSPAYLSVAANSMQARICLGGEEPAQSRPYFPSAAPAVSTAPPPRMPDRRLSSPAPSTYTQRRPIRPTALFLHAARPLTRLVELIKAGTHICPNVAASAGGWRGGRLLFGRLERWRGCGEVFSCI
ncbi:hypothetical protein C8R47DRAFT_1192718 [Mycena vitilis]|nr:hypothetical protein C8R47DRAFT_1192718 [Mycena vitilis]